MWCEKEQVYEVFENGPLKGDQKVNHFRLNFEVIKEVFSSAGRII